MVVSLTAEELRILSLLKRRLCTPIEIIIEKIFDGNIVRSLESINSLVERQMIEYVVNGRITITVVGKNAYSSIAERGHPPAG